jgi:glycosyltransferase involved in cell wall biosynthesis
MDSRARPGDEPGDAAPPLVSVFTAAHAAGEGICVPARSVLSQSEESWEWVIVEDSGDEESARVIAELAASTEAGGRIRLERRRGDGSIGASKRAATALCRGDVLVELDHDDELHPDALAGVLGAFDSHPEVDFVHSDWVDAVEGVASAIYGDDWGFGLGAYATEVIDGRRVPVVLSPPLTWESVRHIVAMPNHLRAWRRDFYESIGGHDPAVPIADDFELLVRTFLAGRMARLPRPLYTQHHDRTGTSASRARNPEIQERVAEIAELRRTELDDRCLDLGAIPSAPNPLTGPEPIADSAISVDPDSGLRELARTPLVSVVIPTYDRAASLRRALASVLEQTHEPLEVLVVGDCCPVVDEVIAGIGDPRVRHWNLPARRADGGAGPRNYALKTMARGELVAYLDDDNAWAADHLESLVGLLADPTISYAFGSIEIDGEVIACERPRRYLIDTSALLHRRSLLDRHGYWKPLAETEGAHDWELVSRWGREGWAASGRATLRYTLDPQRHHLGLVEAMRRAAAGEAVG